MDPNNPVIKLCVEGLQKLAQNNELGASECFIHAWKIRKTDLDACIAAHYIAKVKKDLSDVLTWNLAALNYAAKTPSEGIKDFYPSLYINIADTYEKLGKKQAAKKYYDLAESAITPTSLGSHGEYLRQSIMAGQERTKQY